MTQRMLNRTIYAGSIILLLLCSLGPAETFAQKNKANKPLTTVPFQLLSGGIIIVKVALDDFTDSLNFILDTGSGGISLDTTTVMMLNLPVSPSEKMLRGIGSLRKISYVLGRTLHLPGLSVADLDFHINDYDLLTSVYGVKIDGIMGFSLLSRYIVKVDYDKYLLTFLAPGSIKYPKRGYLVRPIINGIPIFDASVEDERAIASRFYFDTGAGLCVLLSETFEKDSSLLKVGKKITVTQAEGLAGKNTMRLTVLKTVQMGPYKFKRVPVHIFDDVYNVTAYPYLGGLIGNDLLRRFNLVINYGTKELFLTPNTHYNDGFDYSYTGLGVYLVQGQVVVEDVLVGSPGEKAGLQPGDVILAINNVIQGNIQAYKNLLQTAGARLSIFVSRNGEPLKLNMKVASIL